MKFRDDARISVLRPSHPSRGAWIEIVAATANPTDLKVAPLAGCVD